MASSVPLQVAETVQTAHINRHPSPRHDINPSTAAEKFEPVSLDEKSKASRHDPRDDVDSVDGDDEADDIDIPYSDIRPKRRHSHLPPLPDLRFEQSYLHSIANADTWWKVGWVTVRDQMMMPFAQGILYNLAICGWQFWNRNARMSGNSAGARLRRWWWGVNNWVIPPEKLKQRR